MKIQIAGIRNVEDALMCADCGANIIGLLVGQKHASDDFITKELARQIKLALPKKTKTTLITHLEKAKDIIEIAKYIDVDYVQLHSDLPESEVEKIRKELPSKKLIRVIHIDKNGKLLTDIEKIKIADFYFTDSINKKSGDVKSSLSLCSVVVFGFRRRNFPFAKDGSCGGIQARVMELAF